MVKLYLKAKAVLDNVTDVQPFDTPEDPFEYTFKIECTNCREVHDKPITVNQFEQHEVTGSKGDASFVFKCRMCRSEHSASITRLKTAITTENCDDFVRILELDARGLDFVTFIPEGHFVAKGADSPTEFSAIDLSEGEWYEYDDNAGAEVSITDIEWTISRS